MAVDQPVAPEGDGGDVGEFRVEAAQEANAPGTENLSVTPTGDSDAADNLVGSVDLNMEKWESTSLLASKPVNEAGLLNLQHPAMKANFMAKISPTTF